MPIIFTIFAVTIFAFFLIAFFLTPPAMAHSPCSDTIRLATFNVSMNRPTAGQLIADLSNADPQAKANAAIIQRIRPAVLVLNEFDYDAQGQALALWQMRYLAVSQSGAAPIHYPYTYHAPANTGIPAGLDLNQDGRSDGPEDAFGYGLFPGQYAFAILSQYPIQTESIRTFQHFLWKDMPNVVWPLIQHPDHQHPAQMIPYYSESAIQRLRLSSKNHVDIPIAFADAIIHLLVSHPTPPVFDGIENRNGLRNFAEIRLWADYLTPNQANYLYDDQGRRGGLVESDSSPTHFVVMGDLNADPVKGDSVPNAIGQLLDHPRIHPAVARGNYQPKSQGGIEHFQRYAPRYRQLGHLDNNQAIENAAANTATFGLRVDYVLPSKTLEVVDSGIFWPLESTPEAALLSHSDHRLVWVDVCVSRREWHR